jgi:hypothetical protein
MMTEHDIRKIQNNLAAFTSSFVPPALSAPYSDEYIEHWAQEYRARRVWRYGVPFELFLRQPRQILNALLHQGFLPLLPEQRKVQQRLDADEAEAEALARCDRPGRHAAQAPALHGDRYVQPMRPRRWLSRWKVGGAA